MKNYRSVYLLGILLCLIFAVPSFAQDVQVRASAPSTVSVGQQFRLEYSCNEKISNLSLPAMRDFTVLGGPSTSTSSSIQIINGQRSSSTTYSHTYYLQADKQGDFVIPAANVSVGGRNYKSNSVSIKVVDGGGQSVAPSHSGRSQGASSAAAPSSFSKGDVFVKAEASKTNPYVEEEVIVRYRLYVPASVRFQANIKKAPSYAGLWSYDLGDRNAELQPYRENYNGKAYNVVDLFSVAVYPQKAGTLTISPLEVEMMVQIAVQPQRSGDPFTDFFNMFAGQSVQNMELDVASKSVTIQAKALPSAGRPDDFSGLVGHFSMNAHLSRNELKANDATNLTISVSGNGNLQHVEAPEITFPSDFDSHEPTVSDRISTPEKGGVNGSRSFEYVLIPREAGTYDLPAASFSYFDPTARKYVTLHSPAFHLKVGKGDKVSTSETRASNKKDVKEVGKDIRFIRTGHLSARSSHPDFFLSPLYGLLLLLPAVLFLIFLWILRRRNFNRSHRVMMKDKRASKVARRRLKMAERYLKSNDNVHFYEEISRVLWGYVSDKFHLPLGQLSLETARQKLAERRMNPERIDEFLETLNQCEYVRFAPSADNVPEKMYEKTFAFISRMEQELKNL